MGFTVGSIASGLAVPYARPDGSPGPYYTKNGVDKVGTVYTVHPPLWSGGGTTQTPAYQWENKTAAGVISDALGAGEGAAAYTAGAGDEGDYVRCKVTVTDDVYGDSVFFTPWSGVLAGA